ncbi:MAG: hypothetical protein CVU63_13880 [Deltaproteobacteria bacterium HGW-Deltaproteobacteria-20]|nr:MAG: hypothetical protein CVU63_13880 [Deltaproteobacteria bacterium HGW-Deltaproteobacteria-20]
MHRRKLAVLSVSILMASCCKDNPGSSEAPAQPSQPITLSECKASTEGNVGAFVPTVGQVVRAAQALPATCLPASRIADALGACAATVGPRCSASVDAEGYSACTHTVETLETAGRQFIAIEAFIGEGANFHGRLHVLEMSGTTPTTYYAGFVGDEDCQNGQGASAKMKAEWATLAPEAQQFLCP